MYSLYSFFQFAGKNLQKNNLKKSQTFQTIHLYIYTPFIYRQKTNKTAIK